MSRWGNRVVIKNRELIMRIIKGVLLYSIVAAGSFGAPAIYNNDNYPLPSMLSRLAQDNPQAPRLQKRLAKMGALKWLQIGSIEYGNTAPMGYPINWTFAARDTTVYDADGNKKFFKAGMAHSGWTIDSLYNMDSMIYTGGKLTESIAKTFSNHNDTISVAGTRVTYAWFDGEKVLVRNWFKWNDSKLNWVVDEIDTTLFSAATGNNYSFFMDLTNLVGWKEYFFDSVSLSWKIASSFTRIDSECNATTLTLGGNEQINSTTDSLIDSKLISIFKSSVWTNNNLTQETGLRRNPSTGNYSYLYRWTYSYDARGYMTCYQSFGWDSITNSLVCWGKSTYFPDSFGNDTLLLMSDSFPNTIVRDTFSMIRYSRSYDAYGNNVVTIQSYYDAYSKGWRTDIKDVNTFAQINSPVLRLVQPAIKPEISIVTTATRIIVTAPNITGLMLYNAAGRMVASVRQEAGGSISLGLSSSSMSISSGIYIAKLICRKEQSSFRLSIQR
jgi:hypothetical protein